VKGRCDGCGKDGPEREIRDHIISCPDWARLYDKDPSSVLDPAAAYARWHEQDRPRERQAGLEERVADVLGLRASLRTRYSRRPDPLEDT
jgi:hypothetical protein